MHWFMTNKYDTIRYEFWKGKEGEVGQGKSEAYGIRIANVASNFARLPKIYPDEGDYRSTIPKYVHLYLPQREEKPNGKQAKKKTNLTELN